MKKSLVCVLLLTVAAAQAAWLPVGRRHFVGHHDSEFVLMRPRHADDVALEPNMPARCSAVAASFGDGDMDSLSFNHRTIMMPGRMTLIALPGGGRALRSIDMHCSAVKGRSLSMAVFEHLSSKHQVLTEGLGGH